MKRGILILVILVVVVAGLFAVRRWHVGEIQRTEMLGTITKHIETAGLTTNSLQALEAGDTEKARELLRAALDYSLRRADEVTRLGVPPFDPGRNYDEILAHARDYARGSQMSPEAAERAERLRTALTK